MSLGDWLRNGWLVEHETSPQEITELLRIAERDLKECQADKLSTDWRLAIAYNSALQSATAALSAVGYRATKDGHHYRIIQSLAHTISADADTIARLDGFRKKRNISDYERSGAVSAFHVSCASLFLYGQLIEIYADGGIVSRLDIFFSGISTISTAGFFPGSLKASLFK